MAATFHIRITADHTRAIAGALASNVDREVGRSVTRLVSGIRRRTHVVTRRLWESWHPTHVPNSLKGTASTDVPYAPWEQLYGTRYRPPHPGPQPAAAEEWPDFKAGVRDAVRRASGAR